MMLLKSGGLGIDEGMTAAIETINSFAFQKSIFFPLASYAAVISTVKFP